MAKQIFLPSDGPTGTPSLRTLGTGATQAGAGNDSRFSDARTPTGHGTSHLPDGSDSAAARIANLGPGPGIHGYLAWSCDTAAAANNFTVTAGAVFLTKILTPYAFTINNVDICVVVGGTGATSLANCFLGIYDSGGTRRFVSADQSSNWNTAGIKTLAVAGGYTVTANDFIYVAVLIGTQATTACKLACAALTSSLLVSANLAAAAYRAAFNGASQTSAPSPITLSSNSATAQLLWAGVK